MEITEETVCEVSEEEEENEMNLINTKVRKKKSKILDSDSENESNKPETTPEPDENEESHINETTKNKKMKRITRFDNDSDEESASNANNNKLKTVPELYENEESHINETTKEKKTKRITAFDSDSDEESASNVNISSENKKAESSMEDIVEEEEITPHNKSFPDEETAIEAVIYTANSNGELIPENGTSKSKKSSLLNICDSESSEDEVDTNIVERTIMEEIVKPKLYKRPKKKNTDQPKKMTAQDAAKQRVEIRSVSQRMLRETDVSLPYHKPKSYTIKEFLQKRSKLTPMLPSSKAPPSLAIKMSKDQLKEVSRKLDERIKGVEEFYKSDDEEEEEEKDDPSEEIQGWLYSLVDAAVDTVELPIKEAESMEIEFHLDDVNETEAPKKPTILELVHDKLNIQPRLSGTADDIIDLDEGATRISGVRRLVEKFFQHTAKKASNKHKVELNIVGVGSAGEIVTETVSMNVDDEEDPVLVETPGAKLQKLREELQIQMAQRRMELWKQKQEQGDILTVEKKIGEEESQEKDVLDDEDEEFEMTESESEIEDDEDELPKDKPRVKSAFIDEEAGEDDENQEVMEDQEVIEDQDADDESDGFDGDNELESKSPQKKVLKRIIKAFTEDSDDDDEEPSQEIEPVNLKYYTTDEDFIPPNLPRIGKTPQKTQLEKNKSEFEFLTPVTYLTGLQNLNSDPKSKSPLILSSEETTSQSSVQKNLFPESEQPQESQPSLEDLAQLCSGTFSGSVEKFSEDKIIEEIPPTTQDLLNLCSGDFSISNPTGQNEEKVTKVQTNAEKEIKNLDEEHDQIISQLLDEDELERFKKKFESPIVRKSQILEETEEVNATGFINSDDENEGLEVKTKKKQKKLVFSDDEEDEDDSDDDLQQENEEIDLHDDDDEEQQLENAIKAQESYNFKYTDFLDKEAELSESDWGSADEDEKGLDDLEFEQGDQDKFNEKEVRSELERIHMRQLLDEDNREVKLLQELLLEDGELHGTGRKRQFRWNTLDSADNGEFDKRDDDDIFLDEEENEEQWRKMRYKREMFLKKKSVTENEDSILSDSQILKMGQQIFKNKSFNSQNNTPVNKDGETKEPFSLLNKRGSFLSRNDQVLQRLAEYNKVTNNSGSSAKSSKSFVFQSVEATEVAIKDNNNKRKATEGTPNVIKKLRLDDLSPAVGKQSKKNSRAKKLFGNW